VPRLIAPVLIGTALTFWFAGWISAAAVAIGGLLSLLAFYLLTKAALNATRRELIDKLDASSTQLHDLLSKHVTEEVQTAFGHFQDLLIPAGKATAEREQVLEQHTAALTELETRFSALHQALK
jgi:hypothetical protein